MKQGLAEISNKAGSALLVLGLCASVFLAQTLLKASGIEIAIGSAIACLVSLAFLVADYLLNNRVAKRFPWLFSVSDNGAGNSLASVESGAQPGSTVYLVTPDMHNDAWNNSTIQCVTYNLDRGVNYAYLTRDSDPTSKKNVDIVHQTFKKRAQALSVYVANEMFSSLPTYNILVIERDALGQLRVFVELPVTESLNTGCPRAYWVEAEPRFADRWHEKILAVLKTRGPEDNPYVGSGDSSGGPRDNLLN